jgi:heme-degrading monooxygenase HmoA
VSAERLVARVTSFTGTEEQLEHGLSVAREDILPWTREETGFRGLLSLVDDGRVLVITLWTSEEALAAHEAAAEEFRALVIESTGIELVTSEVYSVSALELHPPAM